MAGKKRKVQPRRSRWVELLAIASIGFVAVLVAALWKLPDVERGVRTLVGDLAQEMGWN
ncbi:MAG: hypothetical protein H6742_10765 [Alphaproteobacteria bacterium]|nr:hypothetical protein [Alphaproteobacteria bacterium]